LLVFATQGYLHNILWSENELSIFLILTKNSVHYGYFLGANQYDFKFEYIPMYYKELEYKDIAVEQKKGFSVGLIGDLRINEF